MGLSRQTRAHFAKTLAPDEHSMMGLDGADWHGSKALAVPANVTLIPLPPLLDGMKPYRTGFALPAPPRIAPHGQ